MSPRHPDHDPLVASAHALMDTLARQEAEAVAVQQVEIVTSVLDVLAEEALRAHETLALSQYDEGRRDGKVELIKRLYELIKQERGL